MTRFVWALSAAALLVSCQVQPDSPPARYGARMLFDPIEGRALLFGGRAHSLFGEQYLDDLWAFESLTQTWTPVRTRDQPSGRLSPGMVYDPVRRQIILFGGHGKQGRLADTWTYDIAANRWQEVTPAHSPPARSDGGLAYDGANQVAILFSGYCQEDGRELCGDTWVYDPAANAWSEMRPASPPPIMYGHTLDYDAANQQAIAWGGHMSAIHNGNWSSLGYSDSVWRYDYGGDRWQETRAKRAGAPAARYWHQATIDTAREALVLFGGDGGHGFLADTWLLDLAGAGWQELGTGDAPSPRVNAAMVYDPVNDRVLLFGGLGEGRADFRDTWQFRATESGGEWLDITP